MGFLGGGFFGSGASETTKKETTNITTNTKTDIRDIGLTGKDAVNIVNLLESGGVEREKLALGTVDRITQSQQKGFNRLVGGAGEFITSGARVSTRNVESSERVAAKNLDTGQNIIGQFISAGKQLIQAGRDTAIKTADTSERITRDAQQNAKTITNTAVRGASVNPEAASAGVNNKLLIQMALVVGALILATRFKG